MTTTFGDVIRGVAYGDSWGDPVEFSRIETITKNDKRGPELPDKLMITDDTQMSLFLADALDLSREWGYGLFETQQAIIEAFLDYHDDRDTHSRAPGTTVMGSLGLMKWDKTYDGWNWIKATNRTSDGSGTVMRTSPCAFLSEEVWVGVTAFAAAVTHGAPNAIAAAILDVAILRELLDGKIRLGGLTSRAFELASNPQANGLLDVGKWLDGYDVDLTKGFAELARLTGLGARGVLYLRQDPWNLLSDPSHFAGMGGGWRAHETLVIALMAVDMFPEDGWEGLRRAVTSDGDSDTIGAVAGALVGASGTKLPDVFDRLEPRYQAWIANEADDYVFVGSPEEPEVIEGEVVADATLDDAAAGIERLDTRANLVLDPSKGKNGWLGRFIGKN
jgi:ADP-ribosylglycohydrolase